MTREEAISWLTNEKWKNADNKYKKEWNEAFDMAIEALSADTKGDLISRQWLLEVYGDYIGDNGEPKYHVPLEVVRQNIKDAPSADRPSGEWKTDNVYADIRFYRCDQCNFRQSEKSRYCPNCGARMKSI